MFSGDSNLAQIVLTDPCPVSVKQAAKQHNFDYTSGRYDGDLWKLHDEAILRSVVKSKFDHLDELRRLLIGTFPRQILEASTDLRWGCGVHHSIAHAQANYPGYNLFGKILADLRSGYFSTPERRSELPILVVSDSVLGELRVDGAIVFSKGGLTSDSVCGYVAQHIPPSFCGTLFLHFGTCDVSDRCRSHFIWAKYVVKKVEEKLQDIASHFPAARIVFSPPIRRFDACAADTVLSQWSIPAGVHPRKFLHQIDRATRKLGDPGLYFAEKAKPSSNF